ncbi:MAG: polymer-forming cytoskeletal protein, partial [Candidatus Aureabacteria bacterium]|nr:polymer-forming cytoskeletal protein [Candidatus Auribacterota bacterium]
NLNVGTAVIEGRIEGEIVAENVVELLAGSMVVGTIKSNSLVVREGAGFVGKAVINPKEHMEL